MSSLMASSAPGSKPHGEQQFSRAVSSARQDMGSCTPGPQSTQQKHSSKDAMHSASPPFRDHTSSPVETQNSAAAPAYGEEYGIDLAGERHSNLQRHTLHVPVLPLNAQGSTVSSKTSIIQEVYVSVLLSAPQ